MISHEHKCIFIHIPKCAGTSIESVLGHLENHEGRGGQDHRCIRMIEQPLLNTDILSSLENLLLLYSRLRHKYRKVMNPRNKISVTKKQYNSYFKFTFVRNPWARAFSWYKNVMRDDIHKKILKIHNELSLKEFLQIYSGTGMLKPQTYWIKNFNGKINLDFIGRFENLVKDFELICNAINIPKISLPQKIKGSGEDYREYYDNESINIISKVYKEEIEIFGYSFSSNADFSHE